MGITVKNADVIVRVVKERLERMRQKLPAVMADAATEIVLRTQDGVDVNGMPFAEYEEKYAKYRERKGRQTDPVNLLFTGNMQAAITTDVQETPQGARGRIYFNSALEAAKAQGNQKKRRFFGLSEEQVQRIRSRLAED